MTKRLYFIFTLTFFLKGAYATDPTYEFKGIHFLATYYECNYNALCNLEKLKASMQEAIDQSGATLLGSTEYAFSPEGYTIVWLLAESHASIHTYPEYNSCFIDFFTCGDRCSSEVFDQKMRDYLSPKTVSAEVFVRK